MKANGKLAKQDSQAHGCQAGFVQYATDPGNPLGSPFGQLGRLTRDIERKLDRSCSDFIRKNLEQVLGLFNRLLSQTRNTSRKIYRINETPVESIAKGNAHKHHEFGNKVSVMVTNRSQWIIGVQGLHGNPYDSHTLGDAEAQIEKVTGTTPNHIMVDKGYRGHNDLGSALVHIAGRIKNEATKAFR